MIIPHPLYMGKFRSEVKAISVTLICLVVIVRGVSATFSRMLYSVDLESRSRDWDANGRIEFVSGSNGEIGTDKGKLSVRKGDLVVIEVSSSRGYIEVVWNLGLGCYAVSIRGLLRVDYVRVGSNEIRNCNIRSTSGLTAIGDSDGNFRTKVKVRVSRKLAGPTALWIENSRIDSVDNREISVVNVAASKVKPLILSFNAAGQNMLTCKAEEVWWSGAGVPESPLASLVVGALRGVVHP